MARKSRLKNKIIFFLTSAILCLSFIFVSSADTRNVRGNWGAVAIIYVATMIYVLLRKETPEDHYRVRMGKYATSKSVKSWHKFQEERRKIHGHTIEPPRLTVDHLSSPLLFFVVPFLFSMIFFALMPEVEPPLTVSVYFSLILLALGLVSLHQKRIIDDTPTLKAIGVFIGKAELIGTAESENPLTSYLTQTKCVQYSWSIMEQSMRADWVTIGRGEEFSTFYLQDDTGAIRIDPRDALILSDTVLNVNVDQSNPLYYEKGFIVDVAESRNRRIFKETLIPLHASLYVVGQARERKDRVAVEIAFEEEEPIYVISTQGEKRVSSEYRNRFIFLTVIGFLITIIFPRLSESYRLQHPDSITPLTLTELDPCIGYIPGFIFAVVLILGWGLVVYNSLVNLRNGVDRAWSLIDIQLKRRSDLIPNLVEIIKGYKEHEEYIQAQIATLRAQAMNPRMPIGVASLIQSFAEAYPDLKAGQNFLELQQALEETEQRIALARDYFNQQTRFYNTRLKVIPDKYVAQLGGLKPRKLWVAEKFNRAQETIDFVV